MPQINQTLAQLIPAAGVETTLYTCPAGTSITPFPMKVYNPSTAASASFYVRHQLLGAAANVAQIADGPSTINPGETMLVMMLPLSATDIISVQSSTGSVVFQLAGQVNT